MRTRLAELPGVLGAGINFVPAVELGPAHGDEAMC
jgi:hypothetical protein